MKNSRFIYFITINFKDLRYHNSINSNNYNNNTTKKNMSLIKITNI